MKVVIALFVVVMVGTQPALAVRMAQVSDTAGTVACVARRS